jgi:hypothetical protein
VQHFLESRSGRRFGALSLDKDSNDAVTSLLTVRSAIGLLRRNTEVLELIFGADSAVDNGTSFLNLRLGADNAIQANSFEGWFSRHWQVPHRGSGHESGQKAKTAFNPQVNKIQSHSFK